jgi:hypothetical protein
MRGCGLACLGMVLLMVSPARGQGDLLANYLSMPKPWEVLSAPRVWPWSDFDPARRMLPYQSWCGYPHDFWLRAEFQSLWLRPGRLPPLATAGPAGSQAVLGQPGTRLLFGGEDSDSTPLLGGQFLGGAWLDYEQRLGVEGALQFGAEQSDRFVGFTPGGPDQPVLARPVVDALSGSPASTASLLPSFRTGSLDIRQTSRWLAGEAHVLLNAWCRDTVRGDWLVGFRYLDLEEHLEADEAGDFELTAGGRRTFRVVLSDEFDARTRFYGGYLGLRAVWESQPWSLQVMGRLCLGVTQQQIGIVGVTAVQDVGPGVLFAPGGLVALASNAGLEDRDVFGVVPEGSVRLSYDLCSWLRLHASASALYWNRVLRVGDQLDLAIEPGQVPLSAGPAPGLRPARNFRDSDFWLLGLGAGAELRY